MTKSNSWTTIPLEEIITIKHGFTFKGEFFTDDGEFALLTPGNFFELGGFRDLGLKQKYYVGTFLKEFLLKKGDMLVVMTEQAEGLLGSTLAIPEDDKYLHNQRLGLIEITNAAVVNKAFLFHLFNSVLLRKPISDTASGTKVRHTSPTKICEIAITIPPLHEQKQIAAILSTWNDSINFTESLIAAKQERRQWLMQQLLTDKIRLPGFDKPRKTVHLGDVFTNRIETNRPDLPLISITGSGGIVIREGLVRRDTSSEDKSKYLRICPGDIGYNTMRMWQGVCGLSKFEGIVSPAYTIITPKDEVDGEFMALLFKSLQVIHLFHRHSQGLVDDTLNLKWRHFSEIKVTIPEISEQKAIAAIFRTADRELDLLRSQLDALREQKKGLMQQLLTGKVRVKI